MCKHEFITINDVKACKRCGLTVLPDGKIIFDRAIVQSLHKKKNKKAVNK